MEKSLNPAQFYSLMSEAAKNLGFLSGDSFKVLMALALLPESRKSMPALKQATCTDENIDLVQAVSDLQNLNLVKYDGIGGLAIHDSFLAKGQE